MSDSRSVAERVARNTIMLYFRQILIMAVSLYTVRIVLSVLGAEDYGIYNVVAGVVVFFSFVSNAMATSTQRFLNFSLGENNETKVREIYSTSLLLHVLIAIAFFVLAESVGLWFVFYKLNIPDTRHSAAVIVYQISICATIFSIFRVPYNAMIIAYERMSFFAALSVIETLLKLLVVFLISVAKFDRLVFYSFLICVVSIVITWFYKLYCNKSFETARFTKVNEKSLVKEMLTFSGWNLFGTAANVCTQQGTNIVLNVFTNVIVNAAMGIANQVNAAVYSFVSNFQMAFNPQLVKLYAGEKKDDFFVFLYCTSKFSFFLFMLITIPLYINADFILTLWLKSVPEYTSLFVRLILIWSLIDSLNGPLWMAAAAQGNIKAYQITAGVFIFVNLPLSILFLIFFENPVFVLIIRIVINSLMTFWRILYLRKKIGLNSLEFVVYVLFRCFLIFAISFSFSFFIASKLDGWACFLVSFVSSVAISLLLILIFGVSKSERKVLFSYVKNRRKRYE